MSVYLQSWRWKVSQLTRRCRDEYEESAGRRREDEEGGKSWVIIINTRNMFIGICIRRKVQRCLHTTGTRMDGEAFWMMGLVSFVVQGERRF